MPEIVVAYARADEPRASFLIKKLESLGFTVRREGPPAPGRAGRKRTAPAARIALISRHFPAALAKGATLAARLDPAPGPHLTKYAAVDLRTWRGRDDHRGWKKLASQLPAAATRALPAAKAAKAAPALKRPARKGGVGPALLWLAGAAAAAAAAGGAALMTMH